MPEPECEFAEINGRELAALVGPVVELPAEGVAGALVAVVGLDGTVRVAGAVTIPANWGVPVLSAVADSLYRNGVRQ